MDLNLSVGKNSRPDAIRNFAPAPTDMDMLTGEQKKDISTIEGFMEEAGKRSKEIFGGDGLENLNKKYSLMFARRISENRAAAQTLINGEGGISSQDLDTRETEPENGFEFFEEEFNNQTFLKFLRGSLEERLNFKTFLDRINLFLEAGQFGHGKTEKYIRELLSRSLLKGQLKN